MRTVIFKAACAALALLTPAFSHSKEAAPARYEVGALTVEQSGGKGEPIIFIPGLASGTWTWTDTAERLRAGHTVYLVSLPGFDGRMSIPGTTLESVSKDLQVLIESKKIRKPVLVGHSLGGTLALTFAADHSDLIAGVVAVDGLPVFPGTEGMMGDRSALGQNARAQIENQTPEQFAAYQQMYMKKYGVIDEVKAASLAEKSSRSEPRAVADFAAQVLMLDARPRMASIKVPVIEISPFYAPDFAAMGVDEAAKTDYYRMILTGIANLDVVSVSPARHFVMFDQPEKFAAALDQALLKIHAPSQAGK
jgi:pimeloyl-ACP methyl ester carboxylesterase